MDNMMLVRQAGKIIWHELQCTSYNKEFFWTTCGIVLIDPVELRDSNFNAERSCSACRPLYNEENHEPIS